MLFIDHEKFSFPETEEKILKFWKESRVFERSLEKNNKRKPFVFYEGPPTANGRPGIHHVLARSFKDIICRFKTMQGFYVARKAGWDTHGLPVEIEVEKQLGLKTKKDIEKFGIAEFNKKCKESVWKYKDEWERLTDRIGFWLDLKDPYITYQTPYIETLWFIIKQFWEKKLLYRGHRVAPWCPRCGTALSSHEMAQGYQNVTDQSVYVKFKVKEQGAKSKEQKLKNAYILSWTTTPWTLPGNVALAVGKEILYYLVEHKGEKYFIAAEALNRFNKPNSIFEQIPAVLDKVYGKDLVGLEYEPLFQIKGLKNDAAYKVYDADFVTTTDGTGVVHTAVMYGEDDYKLGVQVGLPQKHTVDEGGRFTHDVEGLGGMLVKSKDPVVTKETEDKIFAHLRAHGNLLAIEPYEHEYPHCWRCATPLLYYARDSWFVAVSKLRKKLIENNKKITWVPEHIKEGRFGEWLKEAKDWNFSRERYWGTPLPVWKCSSCGHDEVVGSRDELAARTGKSRNTYIAMRHGEAESNILNIAAPRDKARKYYLTMRGKTQAAAGARKFKRAYGTPDLIVASDLARTKETALIAAEELGIDAGSVHFDPRLREINVGIFDGEHPGRYHEYYASRLEKFTKRAPEGENLTDLRRRIMEFVGEMEQKHEGKTILVVSHEYPIWMLYAGGLGLSNEETIGLRVGKRAEDFVTFAEVMEIPYRRLPRDENNEVNLHRPYVDDAVFPCAKCGKEARRIKELADVWFDSGSMPFAQGHWPFAQEQGARSKEQKLKGLQFPADYISEAVDQTRGWFYTLLAVATLLGKKAPYKSVISLGHILDKNGEKMSKSKGNVVDPFVMIEKHGADAVRWHFYTMGPPGEPKRFDENDLVTSLRRHLMTLYNVYAFYRTYADAGALTPPGVGGKEGGTKNPLDAWILARTKETAALVTKNLETLDIGKAAGAIADLVDDLSRWYLRRSRRRLQKPESKEDHRAASRVLGGALRDIAVLSAPFVPFFSEALYQDLSASAKASSVHLADWPKTKKIGAVERKLLEHMRAVREVAAEALKLRAAAGIKVRQPLNKLQITNKKLQKEKALLEILKDEVNVKNISCGKAMELDTEITPELKEEGTLRELVRMTQQLRADANLKPEQKIIVEVKASDVVRGILTRHEQGYRKEVNARNVEYALRESHDARSEANLDGEAIVIGIRKV